MSKLFLHDHVDFRLICQAAREESKASLAIVEKDYWLMHVMWSLAQCGHKFELKGGTSLSKGWGLIQRFSEDVDIHIHPPLDMKVYSGKNHDKSKHCESRTLFFDWLSNNIKVDGAVSVTRDPQWDDKKSRNCGIKVEYNSQFSIEPAIKPFVLLEVGFAQVEPNEPITISSWITEIARKSSLDIIDNRAVDVRCYLPEYTFMEKLSAISKKYQQEQEQKILPENFIRHYYDVYQLLQTERIRKFIKTVDFKSHCNTISLEALLLQDKATRFRYETEYNIKAPMYYRDRPTFPEIVTGIAEFFPK